ncbi:histone-lysine N-methyltransferase SETMAR [Trichonephila clavata]|uniref:Histone-lysine N-methyltransferase SETMAR n=1 Tax=Trichonephila clavata TaxID=2740835 RepID=A0A8X6F5J7_TRICU|nr:histone-lysine N-methyltransferase SETMAR [Trichonephila clavata]
MEWQYARSPMRKKFKITPSACKVMAIVFWDMSDVTLIEYLECGHTINADRYFKTLTKLREAIRRKCPGLLMKGVILLHDNAKPYAGCPLRNCCECFGEWSEVTPSPHKAPIFLALKKHLFVTRFTSDIDVQTTAND